MVTRRKKTTKLVTIGSGVTVGTADKPLLWQFHEVFAERGFWYWRYPLGADGLRPWPGDYVRVTDPRQRARMDAAYAAGEMKEA